MIAVAHKRERISTRFAPSIFEIERHGDTAVVTPLGRINVLPDEEFAAESQLLLEMIGRDVTTVIVDLHKTNACSSDRLVGPLILMWNHVRRHKEGNLVVCGLCQYGQEVLRRTKLNRLWKIYPSLDDALDAVGV